jgi:hypothetical protein
MSIAEDYYRDITMDVGDEIVRIGGDIVNVTNQYKSSGRVVAFWVGNNPNNTASVMVISFVDHTGLMLVRHRDGPANAQVFDNAEHLGFESYDMMSRLGFDMDHVVAEAVMENTGASVQKLH